MEHIFEKGAQVVAYLRDSGGDEQDLSVPQQEAEVRKYCLEQHLVLTTIFRDAASPGSSTVGRTAFRDMVAYFRDGAPEAGLILWRSSRFARDFDDSQYYKADIRRRGYLIYFMKDDIPDGVDGRLYEALLDWMNQKFLEDMAVDVKRGLANLVREHGAVPGRPPRGFERKPIEIGMKRNGQKRIAHRWVPKPGEWERAQLAWKMRTSGASYSEIHKATRLYGSLSSYSTFFRNPIYKGELHFGGQVFPEYAPQAVAPEEWTRIQLEMQSRSFSDGDKLNHINRVSSPYLLTGLVRCARCGGAVNGDTISRRGKPHWQYYYCSRAKRKAGCDAGRIPRKDLEGMMLEELKASVLQPINLANIQREHQLQFSSLEDELAPVRSEKSRQLAGVRKRLNNVVDTLEELGRSKKLTGRLQALEMEESTLELELSEIDRRLANPPSPIDPEQVALFVGKVLENADHDQLRVILRGFIDQILVDRGEDKEVSAEVKYIMPPFERSPSGEFVSTVLPRGGTLWRRIYSHKFVFTIGPQHKRRP